MSGKLLIWISLALTLTSHAADFTMVDLQGKAHRIADYRGKWVLVNFWATWCPPCIGEIPELVSLHNAHKDSDLVVIGIAMDSGSGQNVKNFAGLHAISYPVILSSDRLVRQTGKVEALPTSYLYAPDGKQVGYQRGEVTRLSVEAYIRSKQP